MRLRTPVMLIVQIVYHANVVSPADPECQYCEPDTYCFVDMQHQCPPSSSAPAGSDDVSDCVCHAGFYRVGNLCQECEAGYYCPGGAAQARLVCPAHAQSISGSAGPEMCVCDSGFEADCQALPCTCTMCAGGSYKSEAGNAACAPCPANEYSISSEACAACPPLTEARAGSASVEACVSVPGAFLQALGQPLSARLCPPSTYQDEANQTACKTCPDSTYQAAYGAAQAAACVSCPSRSAIRPAGPGAALSNCTCDLAYTGPDGGPCAPCAAGTFKSTNGSAACQQCPADAYAGAGSSACAACPANSHAAAGSPALANCTCAAGFAALAEPFACAACAPGSAKASGNTACVPCAAGSFANQSAMPACETCPADTYSSAGSIACEACAANEFSAPGSDSAVDCLCVAGYYTDFHAASMTKCTACPVGSSRNATARVMGNNGGSFVGTANYGGSCGGGGATQVGANTSNGFGSKGGEGYTSNITGTVTVYGSGGGGGGRSQAGALGGTNAGNGGSFINATQSKGGDGTANTGGGGGGGTSIGSTTYWQKGGMGGSGIVVVGYDTTDPLSITATGGMVVTSGNWRSHQFTNVGSDSFFVHTQGYCDILIVAGGGGGTDATTNTGGAGGGGGQVIHIQNYGLDVLTYHIIVGAGDTRIPQVSPSQGFPSSFGTITAVGGGTSGVGIVAEGNRGAYGGSGGGAPRQKAGGLAVTPPANLIPGMTLSYVSTSIGWSGLVQCAACGTACTACPLGTFRNESHPQRWDTLDTCMPCPVGHSTQGSARTSEGECYLCPAGAYVLNRAELGLACVPCGADAQSTAGTVGGCQCDPGFAPAAEACAECAFGFYKPLTGNHSCTACAVGKQGTAQRVAEAAACAACAANTFWVAEGANCSACQPHSQSPQGSVSASNCSCNAGFAFALAGGSPACVACEAGTYKAVVSNGVACAPCNGALYSDVAAASACAPCPANSTGDFFNDAVSDCQCDAGFTGADGGPCVQCELGKYKTQRGTASCGDCGSAAFWPPGADPAVFACEACPQHSARASDLVSGVLGCVCDTGYRRTADATCSLCPEGYYCPQQHVQVLCPAHSTAAAGSSTLEACQCLAGFHGGNGSCAACPVNAFCPRNSAAPAPCPANSTTLGQAARTNVSACACVAGFYRDGDACNVCERDSFCFGDRQLACPANSSAPPGVDDVLDCVCDDGLRMQAMTASSPGPGAECVSCDPTLICRGGGVQTCAAGAFNANFRCVCTAGSYCPGGFTSCVGGACRSCPPDHWCADNVLTSCAANEYAPANSSLHSQCRCLDGFYRSHLGACLECPLHHVCRNETRRPVAEFDPGLRTLATRTVFLSQAVCASGLFRTAKTDLCKQCPANFYCPSEAAVALPNVVRCPENEFTIVPGASAREQCVCLAGFKLATTETTAKCLPCGVGERCQGGAVLEIECHLQNKAISADHSQCVCEAGFGFYNFECQRCPAGFVKPVIGDLACVECGVNEYAVNGTTCLPCAQHAEARPGSPQCTCAPPFVLQAHLCVLCPPEHFWTRQPAGTGACSPCPARSSSQPSAAMLLGSDACRCAPGHHAAPWNVSGRLQCQACEAGQYERGGACVACPERAWSPPTSDSVEACVCNALPGNATDNATCHSLRVDRTCAGVCASTPAACVACEPGHYKPAPSTPGNAERCRACAEGHYQPAPAALFCEACPVNEWHTALAATARGQCLCVGGWTRPGPAANASKAPCAACAPGYYKDWLGDETCAPCAVGRYNPDVNSTICHFCSAASLETLLAANATRPVLDSRTTVYEASVSVLDCVCERGHEPREVGGLGGLACRPCVPGSFKEHKDHALCSYCGAPSLDHGSRLLHHFGAPEDGASNYSHCLVCPVYSGQDSLTVGPGLSVMDNFTDCKCFPGHENRTAASCSACPPYMLQTRYSDDACVFCPAGHFFVDRHVPCEACYLAGDGGAPHELLVLNRNDFALAWGADGGDCVCRLGFERDASDVCRACAIGTFRGSNLTRFCAECPVDTFQNTTANLRCLACPPNSSTLLAPGRTALEHCVCGPGFQPLADGACAPCPAGTFRERRLASEAEHACVQCPADHYCPAGAVLPSPCPPGELALPGSAELDHCLCPPGRGRAAGPAHAPDELSNPCRPCAHGFFAPERSNSECSACPALKNTSTTAATHLANCTCVPGHGVGPEHNLAQPCAPCADGFFALGGRNAPCTHCGWGAVTEPPSAASSASSCQCNALLGLRDSYT